MSELFVAVCVCILLTKVERYISFLSPAFARRVNSDVYCCLFPMLVGCIFLSLVLVETTRLWQCDVHRSYELGLVVTLVVTLDVGP